MKIKVVTINCFDSPLFPRRSGRINRLIIELIRLKADVLCIQELIFLKRVKRVSKLFEKAGYNTFFTPGKKVNRGGLLMAFKHPLIDAKYVKFKNQGFSFSFQMTDKLLSKGYQKVTVDIGGKNVSIYNTHLVSVYRGSSIREKRLLVKQFEEFLEVIKKEADKTIVAGDFNFAPSDILYKKIEEKTKLYDPLKEDNLVTISRKNTNRKRFYKVVEDAKLDYILLSKDLKKVDQKIILDDLYEIKEKKMHLSDHFGLWLEIGD